MEEIGNINDVERLKQVLRHLMENDMNFKARFETIESRLGIIDSNCRNYIDGQEFNAFKDEYGEKLDPYSEKFATLEKNPDYDFTRSVYDEYKGLSDEELKNVTQADFVDVAIKKADEYIETVKEKLGLPADAKVEITEDENGNAEVKADINGDGQTEPIEENTEGEKTEETSEEAPTEEKPTDEEKKDTTADEMDEINKAVAEYKK